jgi:hypothetical protein
MKAILKVQAAATVYSKDYFRKESEKKTTPET